MAGRDLVAPTGERIPARRLRGLLWHANATDIRASVRRRNAKRKAVQQSLVKVVVMDLGEQRERHFGKIAGQDVGALRYRFIRTASPADARAIPRWGLTLNPQSAEWRRGHRADPRRSCAARELRGATCTAVLARRHKQVCERRQERTAHASRKHRSDTATTK
nr:hypothetical protein [Xanthomonas phaseoli]